MAPHSSTLAWKIPWAEEPGMLQSMGSLRVGHDWATSLSLSCIGEGNGNPLQCSCLENPRDGGAWWAAVYGVAQSRTRLTRPSRHLIQLLLLLPLFFSHHDCCWLMLCRFLLFFFIKFLPWSLRMPTPLPRSSFGEYPPIKNLALSTLLASCMGRDDQGSSHYPTDYSLSSC